MKWSLHMIVRDAEHKLGRTLEGVKSFIDEIVMVDTGSTDSTIEVAKSHGAIVYRQPWTDDFAEARNIALEHTTGDWVMWLDAGDVLPPETIKRLEWAKEQPAMVESDNPINVIWGKLRRITDEKNNTIMMVGAPRIVRKSSNPKWMFPIHEELWVENPTAILDEEFIIDDPEGNLESASERNLRIMDKCLAEGRDVERISLLRPRELERLGRYTEAVENIDEIYALPLDTQTFGDAYLLAARCFAKMGNEDKERENLLKSILHDPLRPDGFMLLGDMEYRKENWKRAAPYYRAASEMKPDIRRNLPIVEPFYTYAPYEKLGYCYLGMDEEKVAFEYFHLAIRLAPPDVAANLKDMVRQVKEHIKKTRGK